MLNEKDKKISHCGSYHHGLNLNSQEMTYETIPISQEECRYMHKYKATKLGFENKKIRFSTKQGKHCEILRSRMAETR